MHRTRPRPEARFLSFACADCAQIGGPREAREERYPMQSNRRDFLKVASAAPLFVPKSAFGANDRITYGLIATGGRGRYLNRNFQKLEAQCVALCDVYEPHLEEAKKDSPADAKTYLDYHELLQQPGIDAVVLAGP